jgi:hypothetical protein
MPPLHLAKQVGIRPAGRGGFLASFDCIQVDHRASADVLEAIARQLREQLLQRCADQRLSLARRYAEVADLARRNQPARVARASANDA